jgi:acetyl-CoA carboxylase biotin carboxyl carrier protein
VVLSGERSSRREERVDIDQLRALADLAIEKNLAEIEIEQHGVTVRIRRPEVHVVATPMGAGTAIPAVADATAAAAGEVGPEPGSAYPDAHMVNSPMVGTFYTAAEPGADPFVQVGDQVAVGDTLCIVEAMKLMNEITSDVDGEVVAVLQENGQPVEYGQELFAVRAS